MELKVLFLVFMYKGFQMYELNKFEQTKRMDIQLRSEIEQIRVKACIAKALAEVEKTKRNRWF